MANQMIALTVISYGGGQDTTYFVHRIVNDPEFRKRHIEGRLLIVGSDTGDEHPHTYANIEKVKSMCDLAGVEFHWVSPEFGYSFHSSSWHSLTGQYRKNNTIGSAAYQQTCTDNLKVKVVDRFVENWICLEYGYKDAKRKKAYKLFSSDHGKIKLILGFAKGEESRTTNGGKFDPVWKRASVERYYPLIEDNTTRQDCIDYLELFKWVVFPSNCMKCFYQSDPEIVWLYRNQPAVFQEWVELEAAKLIRPDYVSVDKNFGVYGKITLSQKLEKSMKIYGDWSDERLNEYKYSHGHCIKSKY